MPTADEIRAQIADVEKQNFHAGAMWYREKRLNELHEQLRLALRTPEERLADLRKRESELVAQLKANYNRIELSPIKLGPESALQRTRAKLLTEVQAVRADIKELTPAEDPEPPLEPPPKPLHRRSSHRS